MGQYGSKITKQEARNLTNNWLGGGHNLTSVTFDIKRLINYLSEMEEKGANNVIVFFGRKMPNQGPPEETVVFAPAIGNPELLDAPPYNEGGGGNLKYNI